METSDKIQFNEDDPSMEHQDNQGHHLNTCWFSILYFQSTPKIFYISGPHWEPFGSPSPHTSTTPNHHLKNEKMQKVAIKEMYFPPFPHEIKEQNKLSRKK